MRLPLRLGRDRRPAGRHGSLNRTLSGYPSQSNQLSHTRSRTSIHLTNEVVVNQSRRHHRHRLRVDPAPKEDLTSPTEETGLVSSVKTGLPAGVYHDRPVEEGIYEKYG